MTFGVLKEGKFKEIKVAEIKDLTCETEAESEWELDFTNPAAFVVLVITTCVLIDRWWLR